MLFTFFANTSTYISDNSDPANDAAICIHIGMDGINFNKNIIVIARNILAPDEIPSTKGPAIGFLKNACKRYPESDNAPPSTAAVSSLGSLIFHIML